MLALLGSRYDPEKANAAYGKCQLQIRKLKEFIANKRKKLNGNILQTLSNSALQNNKLFKISPGLNLKCRKKLQVFFDKILALHFHHNSDRMAIIDHHGRCTIADTQQFKKLLQIPLRSRHNLTCAYSPNGQYVAIGGLDNLCSIFKIEINECEPLCYNRPVKELQRHEGYILTIRYLDDNQLLSGSGDSSIFLWDIEKEEVKTTFLSYDHSEAMHIAIHSNKAIFLSAHTNATAKLWDIRSPKKPIGNFKGHQADINWCEWFPNGNDYIFGTGSEDGTVRLWDFRSRPQLNIYEDENSNAGITSFDFSKSGYYIFAGYDDDPFCVAWNTMTAEGEIGLEHSQRVSCIQVSPDGYQIVTGSWDRTVRSWCV